MNLAEKYSENEFGSVEHELPPRHVKETSIEEYKRNILPN